MGDLTRRATLAASAVLPWATVQAADAGGQPARQVARTLVAYFTRSGNTQTSSDARSP